MACYVNCPKREQRQTYTGPFGCDKERTCALCNKYTRVKVIQYTPLRTNTNTKKEENTYETN